MFFGTWMHLSRFLPALCVFLLAWSLTHCIFWWPSVQVWLALFCARKQLKALFTVLYDCSIYDYFFYALNWCSHAWDPNVLIAAGFAFQTLSSLVSPFALCISESIPGEFACSGSSLPTSASAFVGSRIGSSPLVQLFVSSRYALFHLLVPPLPAYLVLLSYVFISPST